MGVIINSESSKTEQKQPKLLCVCVCVCVCVGGGGVNAFLWYQNFTLDSAVVEAQNMVSSQ